MNIEKECVDCILNQVEKTISILNTTEKKAALIRKKALDMSKKFSFSHTPPFVAKEVYQMISELSGVKDPFFQLKQESIVKASEHLEYIEEMIQKSEDKIFAALKASVAGNVIDFGAKEQFSLSEEIKKVFDTDFAKNDYKELLEDIKKNDSILLIADNSGENVYDRVLVETIKNIFPDKKFYYAVRGRAVINDITIFEARQIGMDEVCEIVDTGVDTPGLDLSRADSAFLKLYKSAGVIIAKGMGNYECLEEEAKNSIYFHFSRMSLAQALLTKALLKHCYFITKKKI